MIDTRQAQVPVWRHEVVRALDDLVHQEELCAVEDNPGDVADEEHRHDTDQNSGQVQFSINSPVSRFLVSVPLARN